MYEVDLIKIVEVLSIMTKEEWESLKSYTDHKLKMVGKVENTELTIETLKTFCIKVEKVN